MGEVMVWLLSKKNYNQTEHILAKLIFIPDWLGSLFDS